MPQHCSYKQKKNNYLEEKQQFGTSRKTRSQITHFFRAAISLSTNHQHYPSSISLSPKIYLPKTQQKKSPEN